MLAKFSVKKPVTIFVAVVLVLVFGYVSFTKLTPELFPDIELPYALVTTSYQGGTPEKVENEVTKPLEQQLASLDNVKNIISYSSDNLSTVAIEFETDTDMDTVSMDMRDRIDLISGMWDESVGKPMILKLNPEMMPVTVAAVSMKDKDNADLSDFVEETITKKLEGTEGVASVNTTGLIDKFVKVTLDEKKIDKINGEISDKILSSMDDASSQLSSGISAVKGGQATLAQGQAALGDAEKEINARIESAKKRLKQQRQQLVKLRDNSSAINQNYDLISSLEDANKAIENQVRKQNPGKTDAEIAAILAQNQTYVRNQTAIQTAYSDLEQMGISKSDLADTVSQITDVNNTIDAIDEALEMLENGNIQGLSSFGDSMADAGKGFLQSTADQLTAQLAAIESEKQAALDSADLTGVITPAMVSQILQAQDFSMPAGYVDDGLDNKKNTKVLVSVGDKIKSVKELRNLILFDMGSSGGGTIRLKDIASVERTDTSGDVYARINGEDGILISMTRQSGYGTAEVADNIRDRMSALEKENKGLKFSVLSDQGQYINIVIHNVLENLLLGAILAILILLFFLRDIRPTFITALSIPISVTFAIVLMYFSGVTLNVISLAGLAVGIGMLVDNSIVVIENIYRLRSSGMSAMKAAMAGASQVTGAITASTLTTISVFIPIVFVDGMTKQIFTDMALTVGYSLTASLIVALTLIPAMSRGMLRNIREKSFLSQQSPIIEKYRQLTEWALKHKAMLIIASVVILAATASFALIRGFSYMPSMASQQFSGSIELPDDNTLKQTEDTCDEAVSRMLGVDGVETVGVMLSQDALGSVFGGRAGGDDDFSEVSVYGIITEDKMGDYPQIVKEIEKKCKGLDCELHISDSGNMMSAMGTNGINIDVYGDDLDDVRTAAVSIERKLKDVSGTKNISDSSENTLPEMRIKVDKNKAMKKGFTVSQAYAAISALIADDVQSATVKDKGREKDLVITDSRNSRLTADDLDDLILVTTDTSGNKKKAKLSSIADITEGTGLTTIQRENQRRIIKVTAETDDDHNITLVTSDAKEAVDELDLPQGISVEFQGENEDIMDALYELLKMLLLGLLMVYLIMAAQFQSFISPLIVMVSVPLAFTGGFIALLLTWNEVSVVSMMGFILLMGIIVNNAIVLIDCINRFRREGMDKHKAIIEAGAVSMRPILMTALTTVLGLLPLALGWGSGAEMIQPVAIVCIGGLLYATFMTLIIIPVFYDLVNRKKLRQLTDEELSELEES